MFSLYIHILHDNSLVVNGFYMIFFYYHRKENKNDISG
nr:MAG TPA: hypothetical protein [Caudoviricetes sp.]